MNALDRRRLIAMAVGLGASCAGMPCAQADTLPLVELPGRVPAPDFDLSDLAGVSHRLSDDRGRPVLVSFWAAWCGPCGRELPALAALKSRLQNSDIVFFALNLGDAPDRVAAFLMAHPAPGLPILLGGNATAKAWHIEALPVAYVVDRDGILRLGALGERDWSSPEIERQLRALDPTSPGQRGAI